MLTTIRKGVGVDELHYGTTIELGLGNVGWAVCEPSFRTPKPSTVRDQPCVVLSARVVSGPATSEEPSDTQVWSHSRKLMLFQQSSRQQSSALSFSLPVATSACTSESGEQRSSEASLCWTWP